MKKLLLTREKKKAEINNEITNLKNIMIIPDAIEENKVKIKELESKV